MDLKLKIKNKIMKFLDIDALQDSVAKLQNNVDIHRSRIDNITDVISEIDLKTNKIHNTLENIVKIGVDVDTSHNGRSWAVVCIEGQMNIVKFVDLNHSDVRHVMDFLKSFEVSKYVIDAPKGLFDFKF